eukprot:g67860.t1
MPSHLQCQFFSFSSKSRLTMGFSGSAKHGGNEFRRILRKMSLNKMTTKRNQDDAIKTTQALPTKKSKQADEQEEFLTPPKTLDSQKCNVRF